MAFFSEKKYFYFCIDLVFAYVKFFGKICLNMVFINENFAIKKYNFRANILFYRKGFYVKIFKNWLVYQ